MPLDYENLTTDQKNQLLSDGHYFLRALCDVGGAELANDIWSQLADIVSPVYRKDMLMHLLVGELGPVVITNPGPNKINTIKTIRQYTNLGLKESKDIVDAAHYNGKGQISINDPNMRRAFIADLKAIGCQVR